METGSVEGACYPLATLPGVTPLFAAYLEGTAREFYANAPGDAIWNREVPAVADAGRLADLLEAQNRAWHAGPAAIEHIEALRAGARAVVTGQQVGLFGGPLYTLHKAATAIRLAQEAAQASGIPHVPIFWLASEDHDFAEVDHVGLPGSDGTLRQVRLGEHPARASAAPVGSLRLGDAVTAAVDEAEALLGAGPQLDLLRRCYRPEATFAGAFAQWIAAVFREQGLVVLEASGRPAHAMGAAVLRAAITQAEMLEQALLARGRALEARGFHQQVLVRPGGSLLFLLRGDAENETHARQPLKPLGDDRWQAGPTQYTTAQLLEIVDREPERLSPNALLRPVFQDAILPTAAYVGGPAEVAYFAQNAVVSQAILGRVTPVLPRLSATLLAAKDALTMEHDGLDLPDLLRTPLAELQSRVGVRFLPAEGKQRLHAAGEAMHVELTALTEWMTALDAGLGRSAERSASKMRYQMSRLRRLAARFELERNAGIARRVERLYNAVYPGGHLQERAVGAAAALARFGAELPRSLTEAAGGPCPGHKTILL